MRLNFTYIFSTLYLLSNIAFSQRPADIPGYTPLVPRLLSLHHKAISMKSSSKDVTKENVISKQNEECIAIYVVYQKGNDVGKSNDELTRPPQKLMDFYIIYNYQYYINFTSLEQLNSFLPRITLGKGDKLEKLKVTNYFIEKEKLRNKKAKKESVSSDTSANQLEIKIMNPDFVANSLIEINIEIKSYNFNLLKPSLNENTNFERCFTISMPSIFQYELKESNIQKDLLSKSNKPFQLLDFNREVRDWDKVVEIFETDCETFSWKITVNPNSLTDYSYELKNLVIPYDRDIGVSRTDLFKIGY